MLNNVIRTVSLLLAPTAFAIGKAVDRGIFIDLAYKLDPLYVRAAFDRIERKGWNVTESRRLAAAPSFISEFKADSTDIFKQYFAESKSQLFQDIFVVICTSEKRGGFFVEIGVGDGVILSNTHLLEHKLGWKGILAEPNRDFFEKIKVNRSCSLDHRAIYSKSNLHLDFLADGNMGEHSTLLQFCDSDDHQRAGNVYQVETVILEELLESHNAPEVIDYMSIDTEGSEFEILKGIDLERRIVLIFTIEINYNNDKLESVAGLLSKYGYRQVMKEFSRFDAWFVHPSLYSAFI